MSERKKIENIFQEKFKDFEVNPPEEAWINIEKKLNKKKEKRRIIPFWWKLSGIAAALVIGFFAFQNSFDSVQTNDVNVVNQENKNTISNDNNEVVSSDKIDKSDNEIDNQSEIINNNNVILENESNSNNNNEVEKDLITTRKEQSNINKTQNQESFVAENNKVNEQKNSDKQTIRIAGLNNNSKSKNSNNKISNKVDISVNSNNINKNEIVVVDKSNKKEVLSNDNSTSKTTTTPNTENKSLVSNNNLVTNETTNKKIDSTKIASVEPNALEELLKEKEKKTIAEPKINRWQLTTNVAPIYFSSTSNGSPLDSKLASNDKNYKTNYSYGLGVNYGVSKKISIKTGLNTFNVDYDTNGVLYYQNMAETGKMAHLNPNQIGSLITIESLSNVNSNNFFNKFQQKYEGKINQKIGYYEIPLEASYKILDKKFGINLIGGMSTLILKQNEIFLESNDFSAKIGEANNLNKIHFSGNVGLGIKYAFLRKLEARIEPVFKYQINTFSNDAGNFKPFVFGVYTGFNYAF